MGRIRRGWPQIEVELVRSDVRVLRPKAEDGVFVKRILPVIRDGRARPHAEEGWNTKSAGVSSSFAYK